jgi:hypothetical protein
MTKQQILKLTGLTEAEFYKKYPSKETFYKDYPKARRTMDDGGSLDDGGHKVKKGETLSSIAKQYGVDVNTLMKANPNVVPEKLQIGYELNLPTKTRAVSADVMRSLENKYMNAANAEAVRDNTRINMPLIIPGPPKITPKKETRPEVNFNPNNIDIAAYLARDIFKGKTNLKPEHITTIQKNIYDQTGVVLSPEFLLAQAQLEGGLTGEGKHWQTNPYNMFEYDTGTKKYYKDINESLKDYANTMATTYLVDKTEEDLLNNYVNTQGNRYASNRDYEKGIRSQMNYIKKKYRKKDDPNLNINTKPKFAAGGSLTGRGISPRMLNRDEMRSSTGTDVDAVDYIFPALYGVGEGTLNTFLPQAAPLTDAVYKGIQKGVNPNEKEKRAQNASRGFGKVGGAAIGVAVDPSKAKNAIGEGVSGLTGGISNSVSDPETGEIVQSIGSSLYPMINLVPNIQPARYGGRLGYARGGQMPGSPQMGSAASSSGSLSSPGVDTASLNKDRMKSKKTYLGGAAGVFAGMAAGLGDIIGLGPMIDKVNEQQGIETSNEFDISRSVNAAVGGTAAGFFGVGQGSKAGQNAFNKQTKNLNKLTKQANKMGPADMMQPSAPTMPDVPGNQLDTGVNLARFGGMYRDGGVMNNTGNLGLTDLKGPRHADGGIALNDDVEVEGEETIYTPERYVFSEVMKASKDALKEAGLSPSYAGRSYSSLSRSFKNSVDTLRGSEDKLAQRAVDQKLKKLIDAHEVDREIKRQREAKNVVAQTKAERAGGYNMFPNAQSIMFPGQGPANVVPADNQMPIEVTGADGSQQILTDSPIQTQAPFMERKMKKGGKMIKRADGSYSRRGLWDNIRANRGSGRKPTKEMLEQERKIKAAEKAMGGYYYADGGGLENSLAKLEKDYIGMVSDVADSVAAYDKATGANMMFNYGGYMAGDGSDQPDGSFWRSSDDMTYYMYGGNYPTMREEGGPMFEDYTNLDQDNIATYMTSIPDMDSMNMEAPEEYAKGGWIQKATKSIKRRGTEGVCTGSKFGGPTCPPGSKRYNLAKTFRKMAKSRKKKEEGGKLPEGILRARLESHMSPSEVKNYMKKYRAGGRLKYQQDLGYLPVENYIQSLNYKPIHQGILTGGGDEEERFGQILQETREKYPNENSEYIRELLLGSPVRKPQNIDFKEEEVEFNPKKEGIRRYDTESGRPIYFDEYMRTEKKPQYFMMTNPSYKPTYIPEQKEYNTNALGSESTEERLEYAYGGNLGRTNYDVYVNSPSYYKADGGSFDNPGFRALPKSVQDKIRANYAMGGNMGMFPLQYQDAFGYMTPNYSSDNKTQLQKLTTFADGGELYMGEEPMYEDMEGYDLDQDEATNYEKGGSYRVYRSNERKGKTHKVVGPGGKVKYFGDPNMGERGKSKHGKKAFYARHRKNLAKNPFFRAYARATWETGGEFGSPDNNYYYGDASGSYLNALQEGGPMMGGPQGMQIATPRTRPEVDNQQAQLMQAIANMLLEGNAPEQVVATLVQNKIPQEVAVGMTKAVLQQMQEEQAQPSPTPQAELGMQEAAEEEIATMAMGGKLKYQQTFGFLPQNTPTPNFGGPGMTIFDPTFPGGTKYVTDPNGLTKFAKKLMDDYKNKGKIKPGMGAGAGETATEEETTTEGETISPYKTPRGPLVASSISQGVGALGNLISAVAAPDATVAPDYKAKLPGYEPLAIMRKQWKDAVADAQNRLRMTAPTSASYAGNMAVLAPSLLKESAAGIAGMRSDIDKTRIGLLNQAEQLNFNKRIQDAIAKDQSIANRYNLMSKFGQQLFGNIIPGSIADKQAMDMQDQIANALRTKDFSAITVARNRRGKPYFKLAPAGRAIYNTSSGEEIVKDDQGNEYIYKDGKITPKQ